MRDRRLSNSLQTAAAFVFEATAALLAPIPVSLRLKLVSAMGFMFGRSATKMRAALEINLRRLLGIEGAKLTRLSDEIFRNFALTLHDFFFPEGLTIRVPHRDKLEALRKKHNGILLLTFHMGHWELGARTMQEWGWPVSAVYQPYRNKRFKKVIESRRAPGVNFIPVGGTAAQGVRAALKRGDIVAMLGDHPFGEEGARVNLFGHKVRWPKGPIVLAVRERTPIVVAVIVRTGRRQYEAIIEEPIIPTSGTRAEVQRLVQDVADKFSKVLPRYLNQWYRFRPFEFLDGNGV
jgi:lauroyl/myristoyl acyltransferase